MPLVAMAAFPAQIGEVVQRDSRLRIQDAAAPVAPTAEQDDFAESFRNVVPAAVGGTDRFASIAPGIRVGIFFGRLFAVKAKAGGVTFEVSTDIGLFGFSMSSTMNGIGHNSILAARAVKVKWAHPVNPGDTAEASG